MSPKNVTVKRLRAAEAEQAKVLTRRIETESQPDNPDAPFWAEVGFENCRAEFDFLCSDSFWFLVAEIGGELVGYTTAARIPKASGLMGTLYIDELYVMSTHRRGGIGSALVAEVHRIAKELGYWKVRLMADQHDPEIRRFYESLGFRDNSDGFFQRDAAWEKDLG